MYGHIKKELSDRIEKVKKERLRIPIFEYEELAYVEGEINTYRGVIELLNSLEREYPKLESYYDCSKHKSIQDYIIGVNRKGEELIVTGGSGLKTRKVEEEEEEKTEFTIKELCNLLGREIKIIK